MLSSRRPMLLGLVLCTVLGVVRAAAPLPVTEASWLAVASGSDVTSTRACTAASAAPGAKWTLPLLTPGQSNAEANDLWLIDPSKCSLDLLGAPHSRAQGCTSTLIEETVYGLMPDVVLLYDRAAAVTRRQVQPGDCDESYTYCMVTSEMIAAASSAGRYAVSRKMSGKGSFFAKPELRLAISRVHIYWCWQGLSSLLSARPAPSCTFSVSEQTNALVLRQISSLSVTPGASSGSWQTLLRSAYAARFCVEQQCTGAESAAASVSSSPAICLELKIVCAPRGAPALSPSSSSAASGSNSAADGGHDGMGAVFDVSVLDKQLSAIAIDPSSSKSSRQPSAELKHVVEWVAGQLDLLGSDRARELRRHLSAQLHPPENPGVSTFLLHPHEDQGERREGCRPGDVWPTGGPCVIRYTWWLRLSKERRKLFFTNIFSVYWLTLETLPMYTALVVLDTKMSEYALHQKRGTQPALPHTRTAKGGKKKREIGLRVASTLLRQCGPTLLHWYSCINLAAKHTFADVSRFSTLKPTFSLVSYDEKAQDKKAITHACADVNSASGGSKALHQYKREAFKEIPTAQCPRWSVMREAVTESMGEWPTSCTDSTGPFGLSGVICDPGWLGRTLLDIPHVLKGVTLPKAPAVKAMYSNTRLMSPSDVTLGGLRSLVKL